MPCEGQSNTHESPDRSLLPGLSTILGALTLDTDGQLDYIHSYPNQEDIMATRDIGSAAKCALDDLIDEYESGEVLLEEKNFEITDLRETIEEQKDRIAELEKKLDENEYELTLANRQIASLEDEIRVVSE